MNGTGVHLIRVDRISFSETPLDFKVTGKLLFTSAASESDKVGLTVACAPPKKFPESLQGVIRQALSAVASISEGKMVSEAEISDNAGAKAKVYCAEAQPGRGAVIRVETTERENKATKGKYTLYQFGLPDEELLAKLG